MTSDVEFVDLLCVQHGEKLSIEYPTEWKQISSLDDFKYEDSNIGQIFNSSPSSQPARGEELCTKKQLAKNNHKPSQENVTESLMVVDSQVEYHFQVDVIHKLPLFTGGR